MAAFCIKPLEVWPVSPRTRAQTNSDVSGSMTRKTLHLHIGNYKTGTSAIQLMMQQNRRALKRAGHDYCAIMNKNNKHSRLAFSLLREAGVRSLMHGYARDEPPEFFWDSLYDYAMQSRAPNTVASTEEFARLSVYSKTREGLLRMIARAPEGLTIKVVCYLRSPRSQLRSWYNQLVKMKVKTPDYNTAVESFIEPIHFDYQCLLAPWVRAVTKENMIVRLYDENAEDRSLIFRSFLDAIGADDLALDRLKLPEGDPNPRVNDDVLEIIRMMQNAGIRQDVVNWTAKRVEALINKRNAQKTNVHRSFSDVRSRAESGLTYARDLGAPTFEQPLTETLPEQEPSEAPDTAFATEMLLSEIDVLRTRMLERSQELHDRLSALEERLKK